MNKSIKKIKNNKKIDPSLYVNTATGEVLSDEIKNLEIIRNVSKELDYQIAILQDLQGPKIRLGKFSKNPVTLTEGNYFKLTKEDVLGDETCATLTYKAKNASDYL